MAKSKSTAKVKKPRWDFPLCGHPNGSWCKKINGKLYYFGPIGDNSEAYWKAAEARYDAEKDDLFAGRQPRPRDADAGATTLVELINRFLTSKRNRVDSGELSVRTFTLYRAMCKRVLEVLGKHTPLASIKARDFERLRAEFAKTFGPNSLSVAIVLVRSVFKYAHEYEYIAAPVKFGEGFRPPSNATKRLERIKKGPMMFEADEIRRILDACNTTWRAMCLLGCNCGFGNADCGTLPIAAIDFERGWVDHARPKNGNARRAPLWPDTVAALRDAIANRPKPKAPEFSHLAFLTQRGTPFHITSAIVLDRLKKRPPGEEPGVWSMSPPNRLSWHFSDMLRRLGIRRRGLSFYGFRHSFETIAGGSRDQVAVDAIMGHIDTTIAGKHYRERIDDERLVAVVDHVRAWLFPAPALRIAETEAATA